jgi:hypothetical protein
MTKVENRAAAKAYHQERMRKLDEKAEAERIKADLAELDRLRRYLIFGLKARCRAERPRPHTPLPLRAGAVSPRWQYRSKRVRRKAPTEGRLLSLAQCLAARSLVFSVEQPKPSLQLLLLGHEPRGKNVINERVESPQLFNRHALKRLAVHESPDSRVPHSLGLQAGAGNSLWIERGRLFAVTAFARFFGSSPTRP